MSHEIRVNKVTGKASFFAVKEEAWHGLGTVVEDAVDSKKAMELAGLDYEVKKAPATIRVQGKTMKAKNWAVTYRDDTKEAFGCVGKNYSIVQNSEAFEFFDEIVGEGAAIYQTAGALGKGERIFITAKLPGHIVLPGDDVIDQYLFLTNSHDSQSSLTAAFTPVRVVCANTLNAAMRNSSYKIRIRHTGDAGSKLREAHKVMGIVNKLTESTTEIFEAMAAKPIVEQQLRNIVLKTLGGQDILERIANDKVKNISSLNRKVDEIVAYHEGDETQRLVSTEGTVFGAYNAVTGYYANVKGYKSAENRMMSLLEGTASEYAQKAFNVCLQELN